MHHDYRVQRRTCGIGVAGVSQQAALTVPILSVVGPLHMGATGGLPVYSAWAFQLFWNVYTSKILTDAPVSIIN